MKQIKVAISGKANSGKNTVANLLVQHFSCTINQAKIVALADPIKEMICTMIPMANRECLYGASELRSRVIDPDYVDQEGKPLTYRKILLDLGKFGRQYNSDIWIRCLVAEAAQLANNRLYIVADVRFINEYNYLRASGFHMIRVKRQAHSQINDVSETEQDELTDDRFNTIIDNNGTIEALSQQVQQIATKLTATKLTATQ